MSDDIYKSFTPKLIDIVALDGTILDKELLLEELKNDIIMNTQLAEWVLHNDKNLIEDLRNYLKQDKVLSYNYKIADLLDITIDRSLISHWNEKNNQYKTWRSGSSRFIDAVQHRVISEAKSWLERIKVTEDDTDKYVSAGWLRTASNTMPCDLKPKMSVSMLDNNYAEIVNDPFMEGKIILKMVISGYWYYLVFDFDKERFKDAYRLTLPDLRINNDNNVIINFNAVYEYNYSELSPEYVVAVDVGITNYATVSVVRRDGTIVYSTTLSRRVHSLANSVSATCKQVARLRVKGRLEEAALHRRANSRKKRELAIIAAQEIASIAAEWGNAIIVFEDLSWVSNTMANGRWNRGALREWTEHYAKLNGSRLVTVNAHNTSKKCHHCHSSLVFKNYHTVYCSACDLIMDRDINASGNIGYNFISKTMSKFLETRSKSKRFTTRKVKRSPSTYDSLKYPGRDRSKSSPTPKRVRACKLNNYSREVCLVSDKFCSLNRSDDGTVLRDYNEAASCVIRTLEKQQDLTIINYNNPNYYNLLKE